MDQFNERKTFKTVYGRMFLKILTSGKDEQSVGLLLSEVNLLSELTCFQKVNNKKLKCLMFLCSDVRQ